MPTVFTGGTAETFLALENWVSSSDPFVRIEVGIDISFANEVEISSGTRRVFEASLNSTRRRLSSYEAGPTLSGERRVRLFRVVGGALTIKGPMTLAAASGYQGGAVRVEAQGRIEFTDVVIRDCSAFEGAAVYLAGFIGSSYEPCYASLTNVVATANIAEGFAAVVYSLQSELNIVNGSFTNNTALACAAFVSQKSFFSISGAEIASNVAETYGGVLCAQYSTSFDAVVGAQHTLRYCSIHLNVAARQAGVVYNDESEVTIAYSVVRDNLAIIDGGVIFEFFGVSTSLVGGSFLRNLALENGGLIDTFVDYVGSIHITDSEVVDNHAIMDGGVLSVSFGGSSGSAEIRGGIFSGNSANEGGVVYVDYGPLLITQANFLENEAEYGAVAFSTMATLKIVGSNFSRNNATFGGVIAIDEAIATLDFDNCTARDNRAAAQGGVIHCGRDFCGFDGHLTTSFVANHAVEGSAVYVPPFASGSVTGLILSSNVAIFSGAIFVSLGSTTTVSNVTSRHNVAYDSGAFLYCAPLSTVTLSRVESIGDSASLSGVVYLGIRTLASVDDAVFAEAHATIGSAIYMIGATSLAVTNVTFRGGLARVSGAVIYAAQGFRELTLTATRIEDNDGGAIYLEAGNTPARATLENVVAVGNTAIEGAVIVAEGALQLKLHGLTAMANAAAAGAGGVGKLMGGAAVQILSSVFRGNSARSAGVFALETGSMIQSLMGTEGVRFEKNSATGSDGGGGVFTLETNATVELTNGDIITDNTALFGGGGVVYFDHTTAKAPFLSSVGLSSNKALYGNVAASNVASIELLHHRVEASGVDFIEPLRVRTLDALGQVVKSTAGLPLIDISSPFANATLDGTLRIGLEAGVADTVSFKILYTVDGAYVPVTAELNAGYATYRAIKRVNLRSCTYGEHWNTAGRYCEQCAVGKYSFDPAEPCALCDKHAECPGGFRFIVEKGYWRSTQNSANVRKCLIKDHCLGDVELWNASLSDGDNLQCVRHNIGPLCAACEPGYSFDTSTGCTACPSSAKTWMALAIFAAFLVLFGLVLGGICYACYKTRRDKVEALCHLIRRKYDWLCEKELISWTKFKLLVIHWQTMTAQIQIFNFIKYPKAASVVNVVGLDIIAILSMGFCRADYLDRIWTVTILPMFLLSAVCIRHLVKRVAILQRAFNDQGREAALRRLAELRSETITMILCITFVVYTNVSASVFNSLRCDDQFQSIDGEPSNSRYRGESYLIADYSIRCNSHRYKAYTVYAYLMMLIYPIGIPIIYCIIVAFQLDDINPSTYRAKLIAQSILADAHGGGEFKPFGIPELDYSLLTHRRDLDKPPENLVAAATDYLAIVEATGFHSKVVQQSCQTLVIEHRSANHSIAPLKILYHDYKPKYWFFEAVMCVWRLLLTCVLPAFVNPKNQSVSASKQ